MNAQPKTIYGMKPTSPEHAEMLERMEQNQRMVGVGRLVLGVLTAKTIEERQAAVDTIILFHRGHEGEDTNLDWYVQQLKTNIIEARKKTGGVDDTN